MPIEAYQIGISFVSDASRVQGATDALVRGLEKVLQAEQRAQMGFNDMVSAMRGAARVATSLATTMAQVAKSAQDAAAASSRIKAVPVGSAGLAGGLPVGGSYAGAPVPAAGGSYVSPYSAAAGAIDGQQRRIAGPTALPMLTYSPAQRDYFSPTSVPLYGASGAGIPVGGPYGPGTGLVAVGSASGGGGASFANPGGSAGALVPFVGGGGGGMTPRGGFTMPPGGPAPIPLGPLPPGTAALYAGKLPRISALSPYGKMLTGYLGYETIKSGFEQGADVGDIIAKMQAMQVAGPGGAPVSAFTTAQIEQAQKSAMDTMRRVPGLGYGQGLDVILQTAGLLGNSSKALELAPQLSFNAQVLSRYGKGDAIGQVEKAVQAGELTGLTGKDGQIDVQRLLDFVNRLTRTTVAMGGQLDIGKYLTGIRQFGLGAEAADLDFTTATLPAYMKIMGEAKAGTALTSLQQVLLAPVPKTRADRYEVEQRRIGLRDAKGNLINADGLKSNTQDYFLQTLLPALNAAGYKTPGQITEEIQRLLPRQTVDRLAGAGLMDRALIQKEVDRNLAQQKAGDAPLAVMLANSPGAQMKALSEGFKALEATTSQATMGPMIDIIKSLNTALQGVTDYVKGHPDDVKTFGRDVDALVQVMLVAAKAIGKIWSFLPSPLKGAFAGAVVGGTAGTIIPGAGTVGGALLGGAGGFIDGTNRAMRGSADSMWGVKIPKGYHSTWYGGVEPDASVQKQSYETGPTHMQPLNISLVMPNGDVLARHTETYQTRRAARPSPYGNAPDPMEVPFRPGSPLVAA